MRVRWARPGPGLIAWDAMADPGARALTRTARTMCPMNCHPTYCGMVVEVDDADRVVSVRGDEDNPDSRGFLCVRGRAAGEIVDNPERIYAPRARERRDPGAWGEVSWDEALDRVATVVQRVGPGATAVWGGHGIFVNGVGGELSARFAAMAGMQWWRPAIVCWGLGGLGFSLTGITEVNSMEDMAANAELIVLWGANRASQPTTAPRVKAAQRRGARVVVIDVRHSESAQSADEVMIVRPGTDAALALAVAHVIVGEGLYDRTFVAEHTVGFEAFAEHVTRFSPHWAEGETGIAAERITALARDLAATERSMILVGGSSMHKSGNSWHAARAISCLPALTGHLGIPGAGMGPRHAARSHGMGLGGTVPARLAAPAAAPPAAGPGPPAAGSTPPAAGPGCQTVISEMSTILEALEGGRIRALILLGTNMCSSFADTNRLAAALEQLDLVVGFDLFLNETLRDHADIVLPGTSWLEETGFKATNAHLHLMDAVIAPRGEARALWWVLDNLATRVGVEGFFPWDSVDGLLDARFDHDATRHARVEDLRGSMGPSLALAVDPVGHPDLVFDTPSTRVELVSGRAASLGLAALPVYERPAETARDVPSAIRFPLLLTQGRSITHFHAFYDHGRALPSLARADPGPLCWMNPMDAAERGISEHDAIVVLNDRGRMSARAKLTERTPPGVLWLHDGWEGLNRLTSSARAVPDAAAAAFPSGAASYEARVQVTRAPVGTGPANPLLET